VQAPATNIESTNRLGERSDLAVVIARGSDSRASKQTALWAHLGPGAPLGDALSMSARHKLKNALMTIATIDPFALAGLAAT